MSIISLIRLLKPLCKRIIVYSRGFDETLIKEGLRKVGLFLFGAGIIGIIIGADNVKTVEGAVLVITGTTFWLFGVRKR